MLLRQLFRTLIDCKIALVQYKGEGHTIRAVQPSQGIAILLDLPLCGTYF